MENARIAITRAVEGEHLNFQLTISFHMYLHHNKAQRCSPSGSNFKNFSALPNARTHTGHIQECIFKMGHLSITTANPVDVRNSICTVLQLYCTVIIFIVTYHLECF